MSNSGSRFVALWVACLLLLVVPSAFAQVSQVAMDSVRGEHLELHLRGDKVVRGHVRALAGDQVVILSDEGELHDLKLRDVTRVRVVGGDSSLSAETQSVPLGTDASTGAADDELTEIPPRPLSPFGDDAGDSGYLGESTSDRYLPSASERVAATRPPQNLQTSGANGRLYLARADYNEFSAMRGRAKVQRMVGWSLFVSGVAFVINGAIMKSDANYWGTEYNAKPQYIVGGLLAAAGMPLIAIGRRGHRLAGEFARDAAAGRLAVSDAAASRPASTRGIQATPESMRVPEDEIEAEPGYLSDDESDAAGYLD